MPKPVTKAQWEALAIQLLRSVPGVQAVETQEPVGLDRRIDGIVTFSGRQEPIIFEVKRHVNAATLGN